MKARNRILLAAIKNFIIKDELEKATTMLNRLHSADAAEIIEHLNDDEKKNVFNNWSPELSAEALLEMNESEQVDLAEHLDPELIADILDEMPADDATDLLGDLDEETSENILSLMKVKSASHVRQLLRYGKNTAGGLMTPHLVSLKKNINASKAIEVLRKAAEQTETIYNLFVVNAENQLVGALSLRDLLIAEPESLVKEIMNPDLIFADASTDQEEAAHLMTKYDLLVLPVVDENQKLLGVITIDDVVDVIEDEATEDMYKMAGSSDYESDASETSLFNATRSRAPWLILALAGEVLLVGSIASRFSYLYSAVPALVVYWAAMTSIGGNTSFQAATVAVRGLAISEFDPFSIKKRVFRELMLGISLSVITSILLFFTALILNKFEIAIIVGLANAAIIVIGALTGALVPIFFHRIGIDPAVSSSPLLAFVMDGLSLLIYFSIAYFVLGYFNVI